MALINGDDVINGDLGSFEEWNRMKNHWRGTAAPSNIQPGMIFSDADNDKLYHRGDASAGLEEILQETRSADKTPSFNAIRLAVKSDGLSDPPTEAEIESIFGAPATYAGIVGLLFDTTSGAGKRYIVFSDGIGYYYLEATAAL